MDLQNIRTAGELFLKHLQLSDTRKIVGVSLLKDKEAFEHSPFPIVKGPVPYCVGVKLASHGYALKADRTRSRCSSGRRALGLEKGPDDFLSGEKCLKSGLYRDIFVASSFASDMVFLETNSHYGYALAPLDSFLIEGVCPDVVIAVVNARCAMRAMQGYAYHNGHHPGLRSSGNQATCSEVTCIPYLNNSINISYGCNGTRKKAGWHDDEILIGMSVETFVQVADGIFRTAEVSRPPRRKTLSLDRR